MVNADVGLRFRSATGDIVIVLNFSQELWQRNVSRLQAHGFVQYEGREELTDPWSLKIARIASSRLLESKTLCLRKKCRLYLEVPIPHDGCAHELTRGWCRAMPVYEGNSNLSTIGVTVSRVWTNVP